MAGAVAGDVVVGDDPVMMLTAPIPATRKALERSGLRLQDIGAFEVQPPETPEAVVITPRFTG